MLGIRDGVIQFFRSKNFSLTVPKNFVGELFCAVFQKVSDIEKSMEKRGGGGESKGFLPKSICLTEPKNFVGVHFFVSQNFWYRKNFWRRRGSIRSFRRKFFVSLC